MNFSLSAYLKAYPDRPGAQLVMRILALTSCDQALADGGGVREPDYSPVSARLWTRYTALQLVRASRLAGVPVRWTHEDGTRTAWLPTPLLEAVHAAEVADIVPIMRRVAVLRDLAAEIHADYLDRRGDDVFVLCLVTPALPCPSLDAALRALAPILARLSDQAEYRSEWIYTDLRSEWSAIMMRINELRLALDVARRNTPFDRPDLVHTITDLRRLILTVKRVANLAGICAGVVPGPPSPARCAERLAQALRVSTRDLAVVQVSLAQVSKRELMRARATARTIVAAQLAQSAAPSA